MIANNGENETMKGLEKMDKNSDEWKVLDVMCQVYEKSGTTEKFSLRGVMKQALESEHKLKGGDTEVAITQLKSHGLLSYYSDTDQCHATIKGYELWKEHK